MSRFASSEALLTVAQMGQADRAAIAAGTPGEILMENAGAAVAGAIVQRWSPRPVTVLCGPGNNGGDGFVVARLLREAGWPVTVALLGDRAALGGDAAIMAGRWSGEVTPLDAASPIGADLVVDAVFGAGLSREIAGPAAAALEAIDAPCIAVDVPSGVDGDTGALRGPAPHAALTVTFCRAKPGHLLMPGRALCGDLVIADIGIPAAVIDTIGVTTFRNGPDAWPSGFPWPTLSDHKYARGHLVVAGGGAAASGAARLAARAGLRAGAGLVTVAAPPSAVLVYAAHLTSVMLRSDPAPEAFAAIVGEDRVTAAVLGPGQGRGENTRDRVLAMLATGKPCVLDADALTVFEDDPARLFDALHARCVLTPHEGEFRRLFDVSGDRLGHARRAAEVSGAVVVLKGPDSVIALPDGTALINDNAPADLATAGSGDVLAGFIGGLLARGVEVPVAAAMGVWLHGECGRRYGPGLIAEDLPDTLPAVLRQMKADGR